MKQYHKIQTIFLRDPENKYKTLLHGQFAKPEFEQLQDIKWRCTEKVDGTNIRIIWDGENIEFKGKTDRAEIPKPLMDVLESIFDPVDMTAVFGSKSVCLYGEGYGYKIQSGKGYRAESHGFILFDVNINDMWLDFNNTLAIAESLKIEHVPVVGIYTLKEAVQVVKEGFKSLIAEDTNLTSEGLIMKPMIELMNRKGERIISKIKHKDFRNEGIAV